MSYQWATIEPVEPTNLQDIMSEQVAKEGKKSANTSKEHQNIIDELAENTTADVPNENMYESGDVISKESIYCNNKKSDNFGDDSDFEDDEWVDIIDSKDWDRIDSFEKSISLIPRCGYRKQEDGNMVTKHDITLAGRKNTCKLMSFPLEFPPDLQFSDTEDETTAEPLPDLVLDEFTSMVLQKIIDDQLFEKVNGIIGIGKKSIILHADSDASYTECVLPKECVIKIFRTILSKYSQRHKYLKDRNGKQNSRKMVQLWAEKQAANLQKLRKIGLPCPEVVVRNRHIVVMSFIGTKQHKPAPKLKDAVLNPADWILAYEQVTDAMKKLYHEAKLIHVELTESNILWHDGKCWFIDMSQTVEPTHPNGFYFLIRDCTNISKFFTKRGVPKMRDARDVFSEITGYDYYDRYSLPDYGGKKHFVLKP